MLRSGKLLRNYDAFVDLLSPKNLKRKTDEAT